jgi:hypothetical protein
MKHFKKVSPSIGVGNVICKMVSVVIESKKMASLCDDGAFPCDIFFNLAVSILFTSL